MAASFDINANDKDPYPRYMANCAEAASFDINANDKDPYPRYMANCAEAASFDINANDKDSNPRYMVNYAEAPSFDINANDKDPYPRYTCLITSKGEKKVFVGFDCCWPELFSANKLTTKLQSKSHLIYVFKCRMKTAENAFTFL